MDLYDTDDYIVIRPNSDSDRAKWILLLRVNGGKARNSSKKQNGML